MTTSEPFLRWEVFLTNVQLPLGVHDGPKVAMPGDRLVNGAGVSLRRWGQSTIGSMLADTDGRKPKPLDKPSLGHSKTIGDWRLEYIGRASATGDHESSLGVGFPHGVSGHYLVALRIGPTAELEYMLQEPGVVGSNPIGATSNQVAP